MVEKMQKPYVGVSILSGDPLRFGEDIKRIEQSGADALHIDVMDGHFVPNLTFGFDLIRAAKRVTKLPLDVHIMISNPDDVYEDYLDAGADCLSFHYEVALHPYKILQSIREKKRLSAIALNPGTSLDHLDPLLEVCDRVLMMSVNPGFSGQKFIQSAVSRVATLSKMIDAKNLKTIIEVDGGVNPDTAKALWNYGARAFVCGSYAFAGDMKQQIAGVKNII